MKYLGVDYGSKRVGIAESDEGGKIAFPITIVDNKTALADCLELIKALNIHTVVVGESLSLAGKENKINSKVKIFAQELQEQSGKDVVFEKEWLSSVSAKSPANAKSKRDRVENKNNNPNPAYIDDRAAAIILQRYLDKVNNKMNLEAGVSESIEELGEMGIEI